MGYGKTYKGKYKIKHPDKYRGNVTEIIYRSSWELQVMRWCDYNSKVKSWASEEFQVPYLSPIDSKFHRYFPDFMIEIEDKGERKVWMVEVKPKAQTKQPKKKTLRGSPTKKYLTEVQTYVVNQAKWEAARAVCDKQGWEFMILTEDHIKGIKK